MGSAVLMVACNLFAISSAIFVGCLSVLVIFVLLALAADL